MLLKSVPASIERVYLQDVVKSHGGEFVRFLLSDPAKTAFSDQR